MSFSWRDLLFLSFAAGFLSLLAGPGITAPGGAGRQSVAPSGAETRLASEWALAAESRVRLIAAATAVGREGTAKLGLQILLSPGWKTYWRSPGDAGLPPELDWTGSENLASAEVFWPAPRRFSEYGIETVGYEGEVVLPIVAKAAEAARALALRVRVDYLVCKEICVLREADLALDLPKGPGGPSGFVHLIERYASAVPGDGTAHGLSVERVETSLSAGAAVLRIVAKSALPLEAPDVFVEGEEPLWFGAPQVALSEGGMRAVLTLPVEGIPEGGLAGSPLVLTLIDGGAPWRHGSPSSKVRLRPPCPRRLFW